MVSRNEKIPQQVIDAIADRINIVDVVSEYILLKKQGNSYVGLCPFHNEKTPSFSVSDQKQFFHCFGCGVGGNVFSFLMKIENLTFPEAVEKLGNKVGIEIPKYKQSEASKKLYIKREHFCKLNKLAAKFYYHALKSDKCSDFQKYLDKRGITDESITEFQLGACIMGWSNLSDWLMKKGVQKKELVEIGLSVARNDGSLYDRFRDRLIFPIRDEKGCVLGFGGRILTHSKSDQKYLNTLETPIFHKSKVVYGLDIARPYIRQNNEVIIVEGYMDVISCHQAGIKNVVAPLGTALTLEQVKILMRHTYNFISAFDGDQAGTNATIKAIELIDGLGGNIKILEFPNKVDPDEFIKQYGSEAFKKVTFQATESVDFLLKHYAKDLDLSKLDHKTQVLNQVFSKISKKKNNLQVEHNLLKISNFLGISYESVMNEWQRKLQKNRSEIKPSENISSINIQFSKREKLLFGMIVNNPQLINFIENEEGESLFEGEANRLYHLMIEKINKGKQIKLSEFPTEYVEMLSDVLVNENLEDKEDSIFIKILIEIRLEFYNKRYNKILALLDNNSDTDNDAENKFIEELSDLLTIKTHLEQSLRSET